MAGEDEDKNKPTPPTKTPEEDKPKDKGTIDEEWSKIVGGKFKTTTEVAKAYNELEKKFGEQSVEVGRAREIIQSVSPVLQLIQNDPELFKQVEEKLKASVSPDKTPADKDKAPADKDQSDVRQVASDLILAKFEEAHGIDKMDPDERKDLRQKIGDAIFQLTGNNLEGVDLRRLGATLENAYIIAKYKSKSADSDDAGAEDRASISSVPSKAGKQETVLNTEEADVSQKLGLTREQYLEGKKRLAK